MWFTRHIAGRTLLWLAAIGVPVNGLQAVSPGCSASGACTAQSQHARTCACSAQPERSDSCCAARRKQSENHSCCGKTQDTSDTPCKCGIGCRCGKDEQQAPTAPPVENNRPTEKVASACTSVAAPFKTHLSSAKWCQASSCFLEALAALDRCAHLCRFTA
jgi:hypothetical protein